MVYPFGRRKGTPQDKLLRDLEQRRLILLNTIRYSDLTSEAQATIEGTAILEAGLLDEMLKVVRRINQHLAIITDEEV